MRSTIPRGTIRQVRFLNGIPWDEFTIVLASDIPGKNGVTLIDPDQPSLVDREICHVAEPIALIAHPDNELAERALQYISVDVEELPGSCLRLLFF